MRQSPLTMRFLLITTLTLAAALGGGMIGTGGAAAAQDQPEASTLLIIKRNCPSAEAQQTDPGACEPGDAGIRFEVTTTDGAAVGTCVTEMVAIQTNLMAACWVEDVPLGVVVVIEDLSTSPPGLAPLAASQTATVRDPSTQGPDYLNTAVFFNIPVVGDEPPADDSDADGDGVVQLPETGTGATFSAGSEVEVTAENLHHRTRPGVGIEP